MDMLSFDGDVEHVGAVIESVSSKNAAAYFAGYIGMKVSKYHLSHNKETITDCESCNIFSSKNLDLHLFTAYKEYEQNVEKS